MSDGSLEPITDTELAKLLKAAGEKTMDEVFIGVIVGSILLVMAIAGILYCRRNKVGSEDRDPYADKNLADNLTTD